MGAYPSTTSPRLICEGWFELITFGIVGARSQRCFCVLDEQDLNVYEDRNLKALKYKWPSGKIDVKLIEVDPPKFQVANGLLFFHLIPDLPTIEYHQSSAFSKVDDHELLDTPFEDVATSFKGFRDCNETTVMSSTPSGSLFSLLPKRKLATVPTDTLSHHSSSRSSSPNHSLFGDDDDNGDLFDDLRDNRPVSSLTSMLVASQAITDYTHLPPDEEHIIYSSSSPSPSPRSSPSLSRLYSHNQNNNQPIHNGSLKGAQTSVNTNAIESLSGTANTHSLSHAQNSSHSQTSSFYSGSSTVFPFRFDDDRTNQSSLNTTSNLPTFGLHLTRTGSVLLAEERGRTKGKRKRKSSRNSKLISDELMQSGSGEFYSSPKSQSMSQNSLREKETESLNNDDEIENENENENETETHHPIGLSLSSLKKLLDNQYTPSLASSPTHSETSSLKGIHENTSIHTHIHSFQPFNNSNGMQTRANDSLDTSHSKTHANVLNTWKSSMPKFDYHKENEDIPQKEDVIEDKEGYRSEKDTSSTRRHTHNNNHNNNNNNSTANNADSIPLIPSSPSSSAFLASLFSTLQFPQFSEPVKTPKSTKQNQLDLIRQIRDRVDKRHILQLQRAFEEAHYHTLVRQTIAESRKNGFRVRRDALTFDKRIDRIFVKGSGIFRGTLFNRFEVAVKVLPNASNFDLLPSDFIEELKRFEHKYITRFFGYCVDDQFVYELSELVEGGSVVNFINKNSIPNQHQLFRIVSNISSAMSHLHSHDILHRNISPYAIYVFDWSRGEVKLGAYGPVRRFIEDSVPGSIVGANMIYASPEAILDDHSKATDVYSFAMTLFYLSSGQQPADSIEQAYEYWENGKRPPLPKTVGWISELISTSWDEKQENRPTFAEMRLFLEELRLWQAKWIRMTLAQIIISKKIEQHSENKSMSEENSSSDSGFFMFFPFRSTKKSKKQKEQERLDEMRRKEEKKKREEEEKRKKEEEKKKKEEEKKRKEEERKKKEDEEKRKKEEDKKRREEEKRKKEEDEKRRKEEEKRKHDDEAYFADTEEKPRLNTQNATRSPFNWFRRIWSDSVNSEEKEKEKEKEESKEVAKEETNEIVKDSLKTSNQSDQFQKANQLMEDHLLESDLSDFSDKDHSSFCANLYSSQENTTQLFTNLALHEDQEIEKHELNLEALRLSHDNEETNATEENLLTTVSGDHSQMGSSCVNENSHNSLKGQNEHFVDKGKNASVLSMAIIRDICLSMTPSMRRIIKVRQEKENQL